MPVNFDVSFYLRSLGCSLLLLILAAATPYSVAAGLVNEQKADEQKNTVSGYLVRIEHNDPAEIEAALLRAEAFYLESGMRSDSPPIALVLHGPEVAVFFQENYSRYKKIVDLAARLTAFKVVDVKVCRTRLRFLERAENSLFPFVGTVAFGPDEIARLIEKEGYIRF